MNTPSLKQLRDNALGYLQRALLGNAAVDESTTTVEQSLARENNKVLAFVHASGIQGCYSALSFIAKQAIPTTATNRFLDMWLSTYSLSRKTAQLASGTATFTGTPDTVVPNQTGLQLDGKSYHTAGEVRLDANGQATVMVTANAVGASYNVPASAELQLISSLPGIDSTATVVTLDSGTDDETDSQAQARLKQRIAHPPLGGAPHDYERWALAVPGITQAWGIRNVFGPCTAGVLILADGRANGIPTESDRLAVYDYIRDPDRGPSDELFVIVPAVETVDITIKLTPDTEATRAAVRMELADLFDRAKAISPRIPHTHISEAVSIATGEHTHEIVSPVLQPGGAITTAQHNMLILGDVSFV